jgi:hypothetical protein
MVLKVFRNFHTPHSAKTLYCGQYIKLVGHLSRHFCGAEESFLEILIGVLPHPHPLSCKEMGVSLHLPSQGRGLGIQLEGSTACR